MNPNKKIKKLIANTKIDTNAQTNKTVLNDTLRALAESKQKPANQPNIRRIIMRSKITKIAAAAVILIAILAGVTFLNKSVTPAYAIEQTIEVIKNVRFMHVIKQDDNGQLIDERWIEIDSEGIQARYRQNTPGRIFVVDDRETVYAHYKDKDTVVLYDPNDHSYTWIHNLRVFFDDLAAKESIIEEYTDYKGRLLHHVRWSPLDTEAYIDPASKLPVIIFDYEISYEEPPEGIFDIPIAPEGVAFFDKRATAPKEDQPEWMNQDEIADKQFTQARKKLSEEKYADAAELFESVVAIQPMRNWAWYWLGRAHHELQDYDAAIEAYSKFTISSYVHYARGLTYIAKGMEENARDDFAKALPSMIRSLRNIKSAHLFDAADDPQDRGRNSGDEKKRRFNMIERLRLAADQNFGYDPELSFEGNEAAISAWEQWWQENALEYGVNEP